MRKNVHNRQTNRSKSMTFRGGHPPSSTFFGRRPPPNFRASAAPAKQSHWGSKMKVFVLLNF